MAFMENENVFDKQHSKRVDITANVQLEDRSKRVYCLNLIYIAFITGNSSLESLLEGLFAQIHVNLS